MDSIDVDDGKPVTSNPQQEDSDMCANMVDLSSSSEAAETDIWIDIAHAFDSWMTRIIDVEPRISTHHLFKEQRLDQAIQQMVGDGLIGTCDARELRFIGDSWIRLLNAYSCYSIGCRSYKRDIISTLIDLFSTKQIAKTFFLNICEKV